MAAPSKPLQRIPLSKSVDIDPLSASVISHSSVPADTHAFHRGPISAVDLEHGGRDCVTVGEDGRVHVVAVGDGRLSHRRVHDARGLVSHTAVKWASTREFATGGYGFGVQLWDQRKPEGMVAQLKGSWLEVPQVLYLLGIFDGSSSQSC